MWQGMCQVPAKKSGGLLAAYEILRLRLHRRWPEDNTADQVERSPLGLKPRFGSTMSS